MRYRVVKRGRKFFPEYRRCLRWKPLRTKVVTEIDYAASGDGWPMTVCYTIAIGYASHQEAEKIIEREQRGVRA